MSNVNIYFVIYDTRTLRLVVKTFLCVKSFPKAVDDMDHWLGTISEIITVQGLSSLLKCLYIILPSLLPSLLQNYMPSKQDILHARKATKGASEHVYDIRGIPFLFVDVGGQRSQRQKWYQCFQNVTCILFIVASSEFDQVLFEDRKTNRLVESCAIFETIVNNKAFENISIILFLNKKDLLEEKIRKVSIGHYFEEFRGNPQQLEEVQEFELSLFSSRVQERTRSFYHHFTTAVDTENIRTVFKVAKKTILDENISALGLL